MAFGSPQWMYATDTGYDIPNSLRFNDDDEAYLSWTPSSAGNRKTWTFSAWVKRGNLGGQQFVFGDSDNSANLTYLRFETDNTLKFSTLLSGTSYYIKTSALYRDVSAWYYVVAVYNSTDSTSSDRFLLYVNGEQITSFSSTSYPPQNTDSRWNSTVSHHIGQNAGDGAYLDGYLAEVNFIDGHAKLPSDFGETDATYGHWKAKKYTHSDGYGNNGFYLPFEESSLVSASGGDSTTTDGDYKYHIFSSTGNSTFTVSSAADNNQVEYLVIAGGGGGGGDNGGAGGAGGYRTGFLTVSAQAYTITVGTGGTGGSGSTIPLKGGNSIFSTIAATGGGKGGNGQTNGNGGDGGSGGGGTIINAGTGGSGNEGSYTPVEGHDGGDTYLATANYKGGGGGGAGAVGEDGNSTVCGAGGVGLASSITGSSVYRAGGGGGGGYAGSAGAGGNGGGGAGSVANGGNGTSGSANTGGGGGGSGNGATGGTGGTGVVIIRYKFQG